MKWDKTQDEALLSVDKWFYQERKRQQIYRIFGPAGSGKSTLARHFASNIEGDVLYAAYTGKAALVMRKHGCFGASTLHRLIYKVVEDENGNVKFVLSKDSELRNAALLIVDECSMVNDDMAQDIMRFGKPILVLGDPYQLPPVKGTGYFTECKPDVMLTEIHRQAKDNPILYLANELRNERDIPYGKYGDSMVVSEQKAEYLIESDQILVGTNKTRSRINRLIRKDFLEISHISPVIGDKLICLKNDYSLGIYNGGMFVVGNIFKSTNDMYLKMEVINEDEDDSLPIIVNVHKSFFYPDISPPHQKILNKSHQFDYGYAITTHKSQGSQWDNVLIYDESYCFREHKYRWAYTAVTRAAEKITFIKS